MKWLGQLFGYRTRYLPVAQGANQQVYVPFTTNGLQTLNGNGWAIGGAMPRLVSPQVDINPTARPLNTVSVNNQIPGFYFTQGLVNNRPGSNF